MPTLIEVYEPGSVVYIGSDTTNIPATVIDSRITGHDLAVSYQLAWWEGKTRRREWFEALEVSAAPQSKTMQVGFKGAPRVNLRTGERVEGPAEWWKSSIDQGELALAAVLIRKVLADVDAIPVRSAAVALRVAIRGRIGVDVDEAFPTTGEVR